MWSGNGYKKVFAADRTFLTLFGSISPAKCFVKPFFESFFSHYIITVFSFDGNLGRKDL